MFNCSRTAASLVSETSAAIPPLTVAVWAFNDATVAATPLARECTGGALVVRCLHDVSAALAQLEQLRSQTGEPRVWCTDPGLCAL